MASTITDRASGLGVASDPNGEDATVSLKRPVRAATTANITLEGAQTIDGVSIVADDRVLVKDQTTGSENGIYICSAADWTRPTDCADDGDLVTGTEVRVNEGTTNQGRFYCASTDPIDIGTDTITWTQVTGISVADGDKGDIVISSTGTVFTIDANAVDFSKLLDATQEALIGATAAGAFQEITLGTGLSISGGALNASAGSKIIRNWSPTDASFPASNYATLDTRNTHPVLDFDTTTQETAYFHGVVPDNYNGEGITVDVWWTATTETTGTVGWEVSLEQMTGLDIDGNSFASAQTITAATVSGTNGTVQKSSVSIADGAAMASLVAGDLFRLSISRDVATDTMADDAELHMVEMRIQ